MNRLLSGLFLVFLSACARLEVREARGASEEGFHYFMPKYYVQATRSGPKVPGAPSTPLYDVQIVTLPDPKQRRTIIQRPGFGSAQATGTLAEGWRLTQFGGESAGAANDASDLLSAATGAASLLLPGLAAQAAQGTESRPGESEEPITMLLGIDMSPDRRRLFDEVILIYSKGRIERHGLP